MPEAKTFSPEERAVLLAVNQMGPRMVAYIEAAGIYRLQDLAGHDPAELRVLINAHLGRPLINRMGVKALANAVEAARSYAVLDDGLH